MAARTPAHLALAIVRLELVQLFTAASDCRPQIPARRSVFLCKYHCVYTYTVECTIKQLGVCCALETLHKTRLQGVPETTARNSVPHNFVTACHSHVIFTNMFIN